MLKKPLILGITGSFGCGKSTVLNFFREQKWIVFDADAVCHNFYTARHPILLDLLAQEFPAAIVRNGEINRRKIAEIVFQYPDKLNLLTQTIYPLLTKELMGTIKKCKKENCSGAFELPLLYERNFEKYFQKILSIYCSNSLRIQRLYGRNFTDEEIRRRDKLQMAMEQKQEKADFVLINQGSKAELISQLQIFMNKIEN